MRRFKVRDIQLCGQLSAMQGFIAVIVKFWVNNIKLWNGKLFTSEYNATAYVIKTIIIVVCLAWKPMIIIEDVLLPLAIFWLWGHPDRDSR